MAFQSHARRPCDGCDKQHEVGVGALEPLWMPSPQRFICLKMPPKRVAKEPEPAEEAEVEEEAEEEEEEEEEAPAPKKAEMALGLIDD